MADVVKISPGGTRYLIKNVWDEIAFQLIVARETFFGVVKTTIGEVVDVVVSPATDVIKRVGKSLTSWLPILIVALVAVGLYFMVVKKRLLK
ncbi:MAG: hypothetical protein IMZ50_14915 [Candidatus Atribacteria bacterium]|nr:hypothetical protein [Candidatus Atribacteria bacterium]